ncbi:MlaD family protein [Acidomonas methanolica]|uniref:MlaD family protein n=1 Tax=Acidomonas methanolica TaxID=437 RepID=UPI00211A4B71|nr:MCE family protein [Acidomonas methanolica]MCQ9155514.1 MCE family protein [Acidomonas methanolica]
MLRLRHRETQAPLLRVRYADELVGALVLACLALFIAAVVEAGVLHEWLTPAARLRLILPESGIAGLAVGNDVELMGTRIGAIRAVHLNQNSQIYAVADIDPQFKNFIRQDSTATIKRRFVVAGASYIDLSRGKGEKMDWEFAELPAQPEPNPADMITHMLAEMQKSIVPVMKNAEAMTADLKTVVAGLKAGHGTVGRLLMDDTLIRQADATVAQLNEVIQALKPMEAQVAGVVKKADGAMGNVRVISGDLKKMTPTMRETMAHLDTASAELPGVLVQAQATADSLKKLSDQLRGLWILGGKGQTGASRRLPEQAVTP